MRIFIRKHPEHGTPFIEDVDPRPPDGEELVFDEGWYTPEETEQ